jgi:predicted glycosyltransferase
MGNCDDKLDRTKEEAISLILRYYSSIFIVAPREITKSLVRFQVLTAASMKMTVFWAVAPRSAPLCTASIIRAMCHRPDDGSSKHL